MIARRALLVFFAACHFRITVSVSGLAASPRHSNNPTASSSNQLAKRLNRAFIKAGSDGVRTFFVNNSQQNDAYQLLSSSSEETLEAVHHAAKGSGKRFCAMMSSILGAVYELGDAELVIQWLQAYDDGAAAYNMSPDLVALSLVFATLCDRINHSRRYSVESNKVLERAQALGSDSELGGKEEFEVSKASKFLPRIDGPASLQILVEHDDYMIVNKPSGLVCYHQPMTISGPRGCKDDSSVEQILLNTFPLSSLNGYGYGRGMVHRLDRGTSGCLVVAKTNPAHAKLIAVFYTRRIQKTYMALVVGAVVEQDDGIVDMPIHGRPAQSTYRIEKRYGTLATLLKIRTHQGRKHQVRIHCSKGLKCPIVLDPRYGGQKIMYYTNSKDVSPVQASTFHRLYAQKALCLHAISLTISSQSNCGGHKVTVVEGRMGKLCRQNTPCGGMT